MPRRARNIYKRNDGRWEGRFPDGRKPDGSVKYSSVYGYSYTEVKEKLKQVLCDSMINGRVSETADRGSKQMTFSQLISLWKDSAFNSLKGSSRLKYDFILDKHIIPELGGYRINEINENLVNSFINRKMSGECRDSCELSPSYVKTMQLIIAEILDYASAQKMINPINLVPIKPRKDSQKIPVLDCRDSSVLEHYLLSHVTMENAAILLALLAGMRLGEICALRWCDVDLDESVIHVNHTIARIKNPDTESTAKTVLIIDTPKSESSIRDIPIIPRLNVILSRLKSTGNILTDEAGFKSYFVASMDSSFLSPRVLEYHFEKTLKQCGISHINFHGLRHTFATRCIEKGIDVKSLSEILGHSSVTITLTNYVHSSLEFKKEQMNKLL